MLFSKQKKNLLVDLERDRMVMAEIREDVTFNHQAIKNIEHEIIKLEGYIRSLRGAVNRMKGTLPEEDIKTSDTDLLKGI